MGTRHLIAVVKNGEYKVAQYGQWDGYWEGQGAGVVDFVSKLTPETLKEFSDNVDTVTWLTEEEGQVIDKDLTENNKSLRVHYPHLSRDTGSDILRIVRDNPNMKLQNSIDFAADSLFCEYAYVVNLDNLTVELFKGFQKGPTGQDERFYFLTQQDDYAERMGKEYRPVKLAATLPFEGIKEAFDEFVEAERKRDEEENEEIEARLNS